MVAQPLSNLVVHTRHRGGHIHTVREHPPDRVQIQSGSGSGPPEPAAVALRQHWYAKYWPTGRVRRRLLQSPPAPRAINAGAGRSCGPDCPDHRRMYEPGHDRVIAADAPPAADRSIVPGPAPLGSDQADRHHPLARYHAAGRSTAGGHRAVARLAEVDRRADIRKPHPSGRMHRSPSWRRPKGHLPGYQARPYLARCHGRTRRQPRDASMERPRDRPSLT